MANWIFDPLCVTLLFFYFLITLLCSLQLRQILHHKHKKTSIQTFLLSLIILFTLFREVFLLKTLRTTTWSSAVIHFIYLMPVSIQFAMFSLLVVFYAQVVHFSSWKRRNYRKKFGLAFLLTNSLFVVLVIIISVAHIDAVPDNVVEIVDKVYLGYMAFLDILLSLMFFKYGRLLHYSKRAHKTQLLPRTPQTFYILNNSLVFLFLIRGAYQILNAIELLPDEQSRIDVNGDHDPMFWGIFTLYAVTEIVPTLSLVVLIWTVPQRQAKSIDTVDIKRLGFFRRMLGAKGGEGSKDNLMNYAEESNTIIISNNNTLTRDKLLIGGSGSVYAPLLQNENEVFNDPSRYDSPPTSEGNLFINNGKTLDANGINRPDSMVGSSTSTGSYIDGSQGDRFGSYTLSPYDILTQYTTRRQSQRNSVHSPYGTAVRNSALQRGMMGSHGDNRNSQRSSLPNTAILSGTSAEAGGSPMMVNDNIRRAQMLGVDGNYGSRRNSYITQQSSSLKANSSRNFRSTSGAITKSSSFTK